MTLALVLYIAPSGYWPRKLGGWCTYEGCQVKHPEGYDNGRCPMHMRGHNGKNKKHMKSARADRKMRRVQLGLGL